MPFQFELEVLTIIGFCRTILLKMVNAGRKVYLIENIPISNKLDPKLMFKRNFQRISFY
jgi:hypothetical protein